jgi:uncharacterized protein YcbK (DUF882 family)
VTLRSRRDVLRLAGGIAAGALLGGRSAFAARPLVADRTLAFLSINTGEHLRAEYRVDGRYQPDAMRAIGHLLRDHRTDAVHAIDPTLLDQLFTLQRRLDATEPYHVVCGYRSPETNAFLCRQHSGVAQSSYHIDGRAVDVFLPDRELVQLRSAALDLAAGGVGYYPSSGFVHLDTGPARTW